LATPSAECRVLRLRIVQPVGSIVLLGLPAEAVRLELTDLRSRYGQILFEFFIPLDGIRVSTLPITDLATQLGYFASQTCDLLPQLGNQAEQVSFVSFTANIRFQQQGTHDALQRNPIPGTEARSIRLPKLTFSLVRRIFTHYLT
jgi:hypothetical protein